MKLITMMLMVAGGLAVQTVAAGPTDNNPSAAYTKVPQKTAQPIYQIWRPQNLFEFKTTKTDKIDRIGGISSRPWGETAGFPAAPLFYDQRVYEPNFNLFWLGANPD
jgi:hypothetical protein